MKPTMMTYAKERYGPLTNASILLASDSERHGKSVHQLLKEDGFAIDYAGSYSRIEDHLRGKDFDVVLLEVTGEHAVEPAVDAALRVKRTNAAQFVGYLADADLESSGLAGDAVFPRNAEKLREALRRFLADGGAE
jgi:DNA-binding NtrC family response regulator